jgi:hypothetical protein
MIMAIEANGRVLALAKQSDVIEIDDDSIPDTLRRQGYIYLGDSSRPATTDECERYQRWQAAGRAARQTP